MEVSTSDPMVFCEGSACLKLTTDKVFYNPVQEFNRDLSIAVLRVFIDDFFREKHNKDSKKSTTDTELENNAHPEVTILEALSATGLRSIRYAKEVPYITKIVANDISEQAVKTIKDNIVYNNVAGLIETSHDDACMVMYRHKHPKQRFTAIDLDPYGCPSVFLDSAVQSVQDGGLLLVTATDMAVLAGNSPETCYSKYGAISLKTKCCHEMALRILLQCIESHANRHGRYIVPLLSVSVDFYIRVFVKVYTGAIHCKRTTSKLSMVYQCVGCNNITLQPLGGLKPNPTEKNPGQMKYYLPSVTAVGNQCVNCNQTHRLGGPIWSAPIHDLDFVSRLLDVVQLEELKLSTAKRLEGMLSMVREELPHVPLYYSLDGLLGRVHLGSVKMARVRSAILNAGFNVSYSHASRLSIKTDAPPQLVWDIIRTWHKMNPTGNSRKSECDPVAQHILSQKIEHQVQLEERADANPASRRRGCLRFQYNPAPHWGPGARALLNNSQNKMSKAVRNQNRKLKKLLKSDPSPLLGESPSVMGDLRLVKPK